jgi:two-component system, chemotaxis family, chemotaxis protein CheY
MPETKTSSTSSTPMTVLLVDPDPRVRKSLAKQLRSDHCTIVEAADGLGALRILGERDVRVLVTELYVKTNGDECLIDAVRGAKANRKTRIVAHTDQSLSADREWAKRAGADAYLIKPSRAERVRYVVESLSAN